MVGTMSKTAGRQGTPISRRNCKVAFVVFDDALRNETRLDQQTDLSLVSSPHPHQLEL